VQLIGMLDSPYVRRVAVALQHLGVPFEHRSISVFRTFDQFKGINPVVKAPTLVCDDGTVLMDSTLIIDYAEAIAPPGSSLMPAAAPARLRALHRIGLALAACEKGVQIVYERNVRPPEKQHEPWIARVRSQLGAALTALEVEQQRDPLRAEADTIDQAGITVAVVWHFLHAALPDVVSAAQYPSLVAFSEAAERLPTFRAAPHSDLTIDPAASGAGPRPRAAMAGTTA
jgi:glutathione S-transferase